MTSGQKTDVFISRKSKDAAIARELYRFLTAKGLSVFESDESLPRLGNADYRKAIDAALDACTHMIVVGSSAANITSTWVEAEWGFYIAEKRADRKPGNILSVIAGGMTIEQLPPSLRNYEVIDLSKERLDKVLTYVSDIPFSGAGRPMWWLQARSRRWLVGTITVLLLVTGIVSATVYLNQPFDMTVFAKPESSSDLNSKYPPFNGGDVSLTLDNREERKQMLPNGEVVFRQLPASFLGKKVRIVVHARCWKAADDSLFISKTVTLPIIPDGSLARVAGNITDVFGAPIGNAAVAIDGDTTAFTDPLGAFNIYLPLKMQKEDYVLRVHKESYVDSSYHYYPVSGDIDIHLHKR